MGKLAGLPEEVIDRAQRILSDLENGSEDNGPAISGVNVDEEGKGEQYPVVSLTEKPNPRTGQENVRDLPLFSQPTQEHPLINELNEIDIQNMTPLEALNLLNELKEKAKSYRSESQLISIRHYQ